MKLLSHYVEKTLNTLRPKMGKHTLDKRGVDELNTKIDDFIAEIKEAEKTQLAKFYLQGAKEYADKRSFDGFEELYNKHKQ